MRVELVLNPNIEGYEHLRQDLERELAALRNLEYSKVSEPVPANVLSVEHNVVKFVIEHPEVIKIVRVLIELVRSVVDKWRIRSDKANPPTVIVVEDQSLHVPSSPNAEKRFLESIKRGSPKKAAVNKGERRKKAKKR